MTRKQYRAITNSQAYREFLIVLSDHTPNHPERYTARITRELGTKIAPMYIVAWVIRAALPDSYFKSTDDLVKMSR